MKISRCIQWPALALGFVMFASAAEAQTAGSSVQAVGVARLDRQPTAMRMTVTISTKGKDIREALTKMKDRRQAAQSQLAALGATKDSIEFSEMSSTAELSDRQKQMEMMIRRQMQGRARGKPKAAAAPPVTVSVKLTAEWPLKGQDAEELLLQTHELREKIKAADLAGTKEVEKLSPEEQELAEEAAQEEMSYGSQNGPQPGMPMFVFVAPISDAEEAKLTAEAFEKAKTQAATLSAAAGAKIGALQRLNGAESSQTVRDDFNAYDQYSQYAYQMMQQQIAAAGGSSGKREAIGVQPGKITYQVTVTASFELK